MMKLQKSAAGIEMIQDLMRVANKVQWWLPLNWDGVQVSTCPTYRTKVWPGGHAIWKCRNQSLFNRTSLSPHAIMQIINSEDISN